MPPITYVRHQSTQHLNRKPVLRSQIAPLRWSTEICYAEKGSGLRAGCTTTQSHKPRCCNGPNFMHAIPTRRTKRTPTMKRPGLSTATSTKTKSEQRRPNPLKFMLGNDATSFSPDLYQMPAHMSLHVSCAYGNCPDAVAGYHRHNIPHPPTATHTHASMLPLVHVKPPPLDLFLQFDPWAVLCKDWPRGEARQCLTLPHIQTLAIVARGYPFELCI